LLEHAESVQKFLEKNNLVTDDFTSAMFTMLDQLEDPKPGIVAKLLLPLFEKFSIPVIGFHGQVCLISF
jgi:hypothetical protein